MEDVLKRAANISCFCLLIVTLPWVLSLFKHACTTPPHQSAGALIPGKGPGSRWVQSLPMTSLQEWTQIGNLTSKEKNEQIILKSLFCSTYCYPLSREPQTTTLSWLVGGRSWLVKSTSPKYFHTKIHQFEINLTLQTQLLQYKSLLEHSGLLMEESLASPGNSCRKTRHFGKIRANCRCSSSEHFNKLNEAREKSSSFTGKCT